MGLKREHRENIGRLSRDQEIALFNVRGEHAQRLIEADEKIMQLHETVSRLQQELDRYKTLSDIQVCQKETYVVFTGKVKKKLDDCICFIYNVCYI
jgi:predicted translin family RNA/ssDNA-binding protein